MVPGREEGKGIFLRLFAVLILSVPISYVVALQWQTSYALIHTVLEVACIMIALSSFLVIWYASEYQQTNLVLAFGFLAVAIFDTLHTVLWQGLGLFPKGFYDLSARYWLVGRLIEGLFLILSTTSIRRKPINRYVGVTLILVLSMALGFILYYSPNAFPLLLTPNGVTPIKIVIEYLIISLFIFFLLRVYEGHFKEDLITRSYLIVAVLIAIPAELCFTVFTTITNFYNVLGHVLKISYYYYFLRAVFAAFIAYPYKQLSLTEERFYKAFHLNPSMMFITTVDGSVFLDVNDSYARSVGIPREEIIGRTADEVNLLGEEDKIEVRKILAQGGKLNNQELRYMTKYGEQKTMLASTDTIVLDNKTCILTVANDVTDKVRLEKDMTRLDRLNLVGEMAASIGHEVRNPMTTVRGYLQMFQTKDQFAGYQRQISTMIEELDRANAIITDFLSLANDKHVEMKRGSLNDVILALLPLLEAEAFRTGHVIRTELGNISDSDFSEKEIRQILLNLVRNSFEAMESHGLVTIRTFQKGDSIILSVRDTGSGIPEEVVNLLGTPFVTTKENGTGLGLAVCYRIALSHMADIALDTSIHGTTFTVTFNSPETKGKEFHKKRIRKRTMSRLMGTISSRPDTG